MSATGMQVQVILPADLSKEFSSEATPQIPGAQLLSVEHLTNPAVYGFDLQAVLDVVKLIVETGPALIALAAPLRKLLKKSPAPIVVTSALGRVTLDPRKNLSPEEIRRLLRTLAAL